MSHWGLCRNHKFSCKLLGTGGAWGALSTVQPAIIAVEANYVIVCIIVKSVTIYWNLYQFSMTQLQCSVCHKLQ